MSNAPGKAADTTVAAVAEAPAKQRSRKPDTGTYDAVFALQRSAGNQAVKSLLTCGSGRPLDNATRQEMEEKFNEDFSNVRVHSGVAAAASAAALRANAWTSGRDIVFGDGFYSPSTGRGKKLLAHELAHVVQQRRGGLQPKTFERSSASERDAKNAAAQFAGDGPVSVQSSTATGVAREEAETPWWKKRLNPLYQKALEVLPKQAAEKLEEVNETARLLVEATGASDAGLNLAVKQAEPVLKPIADYLGVPSGPAPAAKTGDNTPATALGTRRKEAQADFVKSGEAALADPVRNNKYVPDLPPLDVLLRPDPPPTAFEAKLKAGKPFQIQIHPKPDIDPRNAIWLDRKPSEEEMKNMLFTDPNNPYTKIWVDQGRAVDLEVDNDTTMPIRDFKTNELRGYRVRHGQSMWVLDRNGEIVSGYGLEQPLEHPTIDPIDVAMLAADLGPIAVKGLQAGGKALFETIAKSGSREIGDVSGDAVSKLLARDASDALAEGASHPSALPAELQENAIHGINGESLQTGAGEPSFGVAGKGHSRWGTSLNVDEPLAVGEPGIAAAESMRRARDLGNRQFLDFMTNQATKGERREIASAARSAPDLSPVSVAEHPSALITRPTLRGIQEWDTFTAEVMTKKGPSLAGKTPSQVKVALNKEIVEQLKNPKSAAAKAISKALSDQLGLPPAELFRRVRVQRVPVKN